MKNILIHIGFIALLTGCTINNYHVGNFSPTDYSSIKNEASVVQTLPPAVEAKPVTVVKEVVKEVRKVKLAAPKPVVRAKPILPAPVETPLPAPQLPNKARIRPECGPYIPLPVPEPVRIDFEELAAAKTSQEINAIALKNVKDLHAQFKDFFARREKNYNDYVKRCVIN